MSEIKTNNTKLIISSILSISVWISVFTGVVIMVAMYYCKIKIESTFSYLFYLPLCFAILSIFILIIQSVILKEKKKLWWLVVIAPIILFEFFIFLTLKPFGAYYLHFSLRQMVAAILIISISSILTLYRKKYIAIFFVINILIFFAVLFTSVFLKNGSEVYSECSLQSIEESAKLLNNNIFNPYE